MGCFGSRVADEPSCPVKDAERDDECCSQHSMAIDSRQPVTVADVPRSIPLAGWKRLEEAEHTKSDDPFRLYVSPCLEYASYVSYPMTYQGKLFTEGVERTTVLQKKSISSAYTVVLTDRGDVVLCDGTTYLVVKNADTLNIPEWKSGRYRNFFFSMSSDVLLIFNALTDKTARVLWIPINCQELNTPSELCEYTEDCLALIPIGVNFFSSSVPVYLKRRCPPDVKYYNSSRDCVLANMHVLVLKDKCIIDVNPQMCGQSNGDWFFILSIEDHQYLSNPGMKLMRVHWDSKLYRCFGFFKCEDSDIGYLRPVYALSKRLLRISWLDNVHVVPIIQEQHMNVQVYANDLPIGQLNRDFHIHDDRLDRYDPVFYHPAVSGNYDNNCSTVLVRHVNIGERKCSSLRERTIPWYLISMQYMDEVVYFHSGGMVSKYKSLAEQKEIKYYPITAQRIDDEWLVRVPALEICAVFKPGFASRVVPQFVVDRVKYPAAQIKVVVKWMDVFLEELSLMFP